MATNKILIVDDNKNNRMILSLMLDDYMEDNVGINFEITEAEDGLKALNKCKEENFDIIFMDIMMPNMDGIEATKEIRALHKDVMIIAVSAVDDAQRQKEILSNGAEDYISKPINADIFLSRIGNYLSLINSRHHTRVQNDEAVNLYSPLVFSRQLVFNIKNDDDLAEFWEYYLLNDEIKIDNLSDVVRALFALGELQLKLKQKFSIVIEECEDNFYFSMRDLGKLDARFIKLVMAKNPVLKGYKHDSNVISFMLEKVSSVAKEEPLHVEVVPEKTVPTKEVETTVEYVKESEEIQVFDYMDDEDLVEIEDYVAQLNSLLLMVGSGDVDANETEEIVNSLEKIARIMSIYNESYSIGQALQILSQTINGNREEFMKISSDIGPMCAAFSIDIDNWLQMTFKDGAPSVNFLDDTITANAQTIGSMLNMDDTASADDSIDDIFDF